MTSSGERTRGAARPAVDGAPRVGKVTRRDVLRGLAGFGGLVLGMSVLPSCGATPDLPPDPSTLGPRRDWEHDLFLSIDTHGTVRVVAHRSEMGTGIRTTLPMAMADELGADWERVVIVQADGDARYGSQNTDGSRSIRRFLEPLRLIAATARTMIVSAAATRWGVPAEQCRAADHRVWHDASGRSLWFEELIPDAMALPVPDAEQVQLSDPGRWRYIGKGVPLYDGQDIVRGRGTFGMDLDMEGMSVAVIARPPVVGGRVTSYDEAAALAVPGVRRVVRLDDGPSPPAFFPVGGVAVLAGDTWSALKGREALSTAFEAGDNGSYDSTRYMSELALSSKQAGRTVRSKGDVDAALAGAERVVEATYELPHLAHASMEPPAALARITGSGDARTCECWAPTQNPQAAQQMVSAVLGLPMERVVIHVTLLGGGFGRKSKPDFVCEAALLSRAMDGAPVKVVWTREDDIRHDYLHACAAISMTAGLDATGRCTAWRIGSAFPSISSTFQPGVTSGSDGEMNQGVIDIPLDVPNLRFESCRAEAHVRIGWLRAVCNVFHAFALGSFADELAAANDTDPAEQLLQLIGPPRRYDPADENASYGNYGESLETYPIDTARFAAVVRAAAERAGWGRRLPRGKGMGIAVHRSFLAYVANVVEVEVTRDGRLTIPRVTVVADVGLPVNPDRVVAQFEGAAVFGASVALTGAITARDGAIEQSNFHDYKLARMPSAPRRIDVHLLNTDAPPAGVGEPGVPPFAPALCNAIFAATGQRIRRLPLSEHDLSWS